MKEQLKELHQKMLREHPELEKLRMQMNRYVGLMFFLFITGGVLFLVGAIKDIMILFVLSIVLLIPTQIFLAMRQEKEAPYFSSFDQVVRIYLPEMLTHFPGADWKYYGTPPLGAGVLNCGLFTQDERLRSYIQIDHWMEGAWKGRQVRMGKVLMAHPVKKRRKVNRAWQPSLLLWIAYPEAPSGAVQVFPRKIVDWLAGDEHSRSIRRPLLKVMPTVGKRFEVNFPGLKARVAVFDSGGLAQGWLNNRTNLDHLKRFQQQSDRFCFMALKEGQLAILLFGEDLFKTPYGESLQYANVFNVYGQTVLNALKLLDAFDEEAEING